VDQLFKASIGVLRRCHVAVTVERRYVLLDCVQKTRIQINGYRLSSNKKRFYWFANPEQYMERFPNNS